MFINLIKINMANFSKNLGNIVTLFESSKGSLMKCMNICSKELEELFDSYENLMTIQDENKRLTEELAKKDEIINNLLAKDNNFNNVSMLKKQDKQICDLTTQITVLDKQIKYYKGLSQTNSELNEKVELYVNDHINASDEILNEVSSYTLLEEEHNDDTQSNIVEEVVVVEKPHKKKSKSKKDNTTSKSKSSQKDKKTDKDEKKSSKKSSKINKEKTELEEPNEVVIEENIDEKSHINKINKSNYSSKLTEEEEDNLEIFEDSTEKEYYIHNDSNRIYEILDSDGNVGDFIGIMKKGKFIKF